MGPRRLSGVVVRPLNFTVRGPMTALLLLVPVSGGAGLALLSATRLPRNESYWWRTTIALAAVSALVNALSAFRFGGALYRDAFALAAVATFCAVTVGWVGWTFRDKSSLQRIMLAALTLPVFAVAAPFIGLFAHCTSGDCL